MKSVVARKETDSIIESVVYTSEDGKEIRLTFDTVKQYLVSGDATKVSDEEVVLFMKLCEAQKLNPFRRDVYLIKFGDEPASLVVSKDVFIRRAQKSGLCNGWRAGVIIQHNDGTVEERQGTLVLPDEKLVGGWAEVFRKDWQIPLKVTVNLSEYIRRRKDGQIIRSWQQMPATMIRKVALEQALREAFMEELQGLYGAEEMGAELDETPEVQPAVVPELKEVENKPAVVVQPEEIEQAEEVQISQEEVKPSEESRQTIQVSISQDNQSDEYQTLYIREVNIIKSKSGKDYLKIIAYTDDAEKKILYAEANEKTTQLEKNAVIKAKVSKENNYNMLVDFSKVETASV
ncbi:phage recombination protein Bet [Caldicellulosiruptor morganii]|uniref:Phage recombination protein Bet n=1 Tax=Caldicellulosiruptor morganii TaxID=1387555 RepID=A0ABY7BN28_9FIRM|nr:phage recombination protein Bet [Caldicellulosiruptor morganii]WAM33287.1 phage recombination protein Bet [Caldicellulosiruptor morganii]